MSFSGRLNREVGETPTRSRHCKMGVNCIATVQFVWEGAGNNDHKPGDLPSFSRTKTAYEDRGVRQQLAFTH